MEADAFRRRPLTGGINLASSEGNRVVVAMTARLTVLQQGQRQKVESRFDSPAPHFPDWCSVSVSVQVADNLVYDKHTRHNITKDTTNCMTLYLTRVMLIRANP